MTSETPREQIAAAVVVLDGIVGAGLEDKENLSDLRAKLIALDAAIAADADCVWDEPMPPGDRVTARTFDEAVEHALEKAYPERPETVEVAAWRRMEATPDMLTGVLDQVLDHLDEEVGDPNGEPTEPTDEMREAERTFVAAILELYEPQGLEVAEIVEVDVEDWEAKMEGSP